MKYDLPVSRTEQNISVQNKKIIEEYRILFTNIYWCAKEEMAILKIQSLNNYCKNT